MYNTVSTKYILLLLLNICVQCTIIKYCYDEVFSVGLLRNFHLLGFTIIK